MLLFLFYTLLIICLGILVRIFWVPLLILGTILYIIAGILASSAIAAICFQFFTWILSQGENYGSFGTYFKYALVFFTVAMSVYGLIVSDIFEYGVNFIKNNFKKY